MSHQIGQRHGAERQQQEVAHGLPAAQVNPHHARGEEQDEQQHSKLADGCGYLVHHHVAKANTHHEVEHGTEAGEEHRPRHTLAVEHQEEGEIDQCRARLALQDNQQHGQQDKQGDEQGIAGFVDDEVIGIHALGQGQGCGELGKFGGLQTHGPQNEPRTRAFGIGGNKDGDDKQQHQAKVDEVGKDIVELIVEHEQHKAQTEGADNPHKLLTRTGGEVEQVLVAKVIAGPADAEPSTHHQHQVNRYRYPVDVFPY